MNKRFYTEWDRAIEIIREMRGGLEIGLNALQAQGWTRHRADEIAQIEAAITNARKALEE